MISVFSYFLNKNKFTLAEDSSKKERGQIYQFINDPELNKTKEGKITILMYRLTMCGIIGEACTNNPSDGDINSKRSVVGMLSNAIVLPLANPPASGIYWAKNTLQNAGFIPKAQAATGFGITAISPFSKIWSKLRDVAYMIIVLVLLAIGFMIMFRMKLNPQTVISIENSLPKIVIALLLITFSFPIAGFLIDLMYFLIGLIISILSTADVGLLKNTNVARIDLLDRYAGASLLEIWPLGFNFNVYTVGSALLDVLPKDINGLIRNLFGVFGTIYFIRTTHTFWEKLPESFENIGIATVESGKLVRLLSWGVDILLFLILVNFIGPILVGLIIFFTVVFLLFRVFFILITTYLQILLLIIFSPLILMLEAIPSKSIFSYWFKNLFVNLLTFPLVVTIILVGHLISEVNTSSGSTAWAPPFLYGIDPSAFQTLLGLGIILLIPDFIKVMKELLGVKGLPINMGLGTFFGGVGAVAGGAQGGLGVFTSLTQMPFIGAKIMTMAAGQKGKNILGDLIYRPPSEEYASKVLERDFPSQKGGS